MKIIDQSFEIINSEDELIRIPLVIEKAARTCYKSENKIDIGSAGKLCKNLIKRGHEAMLEHGIITVRFITDRGVTHELVRHRIGTAFAQESTRFVNYKDKDMEFIRPVFDWTDNNDKSIFWEQSLLMAEKNYNALIMCGCSPQEARSVLPNSLKTEIVVTANIREWRHIFRLRTAKDAHPQIRELMLPLLEELKYHIPVLFDDIEINK